MTTVNFYKLNGEQKLHAISQIATLNNEHNLLQVYSEEAITKELEQDLNIDQNFEFEIINDDEVLVSIREFVN